MARLIWNRFRWRLMNDRIASATVDPDTLLFDGAAVLFDTDPVVMR